MGLDSTELGESPESGESHSDVWVCCHPIPGDLLPVAVHCSIAYRCLDDHGKLVYCVSSANPAGMLKDLAGSVVANRGCETWWPWQGAWGPIVPYSGPMNLSHPDFPFWQKRGEVGTGTPPSPSAGACHELDLSSCPGWQECMADLSQALRNCCVHYELFGDHGPNSNAYIRLLLKSCLCQSTTEHIELAVHEQSGSVFGAVGEDYDWKSEFCGPDADESCAALCPYLE